MIIDLNEDELKYLNDSLFFNKDRADKEITFY